MPEMDGLEVCRQIRKPLSVPILFLSARDDEIDRVLGLEIGGDDYVTKPFSPRELVARVNAILKRANGGGGEPVRRWTRQAEARRGAAECASAAPVAADSAGVRDPRRRCSRGPAWFSAASS